MNEEKTRWAVSITNLNLKLNKAVMRMLEHLGFKTNLSSNGIKIWILGGIKENYRFMEIIDPITKNKKPSTLWKSKKFREEREEQSKEKVIKRLRKLEEELGRSPIAKDSVKLTAAAKRYFGSWSKAKEEARLK